MLTVSNLAKAYGPQTLFTDATLRLLPGDRCGLVGPNGAGKTTLFSIILGEVEADSGTVELERGTRIGFLPQESAPTGEETVLQLATSVSPEMTEIYAALRHHPDPNAPENLSAIERFIELDGYQLEARAQQVLSGLAFASEDIDQPANRLSGGWIMRAHLARLLVMEPDLLILDEPTNHLDLETLGWFQDQLCNYRGAILTISHDRAFLNAICESIIEIAHQKVTRYTGNFDAYLIEKKAREEQLLGAYQNQQREIAHLEAFVNRFRAQANKASQAQSRLKQLEKMERIEAPLAEAGTIHFNFPQPPRSGQRVVTLNQVGQAYGAHRVYRDLDFSLERGERVVLVGPNGAGKSTLLKIIADHVPIDAGERIIGHNVTIGYFSQQRTEILDPEKTVLDEATAKLPQGMNEQQVRTLLGAFLLKGDAVFKKIKVLSGGEKSRLALVKLLLDPPNLLLLDEPTTHLDLGSIDALIRALSDYKGSVIFVSHDVHFIRALAQKVVRIESGRVTQYPGDYDYYLFKSESGDARSGLITGLSNKRPEQAKAEAKAKTPTLSAKERRRAAAQAREAQKHERKALEKEIKTLEAAIIDLEKAQGALNERFAKGPADADMRKLHFEAGKLEAALQEKNQRWETAVERLSEVTTSA